jgi:predicted nucleotidyltransferase component of viral defense system
MLTLSQIQRLAQRNHIGAHAQERDYIQHILLYSIYSLSQTFIFKGGTALRVVYRGNRYSEDLDFNGPDDAEAIKAAWKKATHELFAFGIQAEIRAVRLSGKGYSFDVSYQGPLFDGQDRTKGKVRIDVNLRQEVVETRRKLVAPEYDDLRPFVITALTPQHLMAEKVRAFLMRAKPRDAYDIWLLNQQGVNTSHELVAAKLAPFAIALTAENIQITLEKAHRTWERDLQPLLPQFLPWETVAPELSAQLMLLLY